MRLDGRHLAAVEARLVRVCHKKLIDDMPKVSLSSHMNGLRSPHFLRFWVTLLLKMFC